MKKKSEKIKKKNKPIKSVSQYLEEINNLLKEKSGEFAFRGQGKKSYDISSSAARRLNLKGADSDDLKCYIGYNNHLISNAMMKGYHHKGNTVLSEIELLAELQHHGAATGLIDFSRSSLVALYFATVNINDNEQENSDNQEETIENAAVYIINIREHEKYNRLNNTHHNKSFEELINELEGHLWIWEPSDLNNRIPKQHSVFVFGKPEIEKESVERIEIDANSKYKILKELTNIHNISDVTLFSDLSGYAKANSYDKPFFDIGFNEAMDKAMFEIFENHDNEKAIQYLIEARMRNRICPEPLILRATLKESNKDYEGALKDYERLIILTPDNPILFFGRGKAKHHLMDYNGAIIDYEKAKELGYEDEMLEFHLNNAKEKKEPPKLMVKEKITKEFYWK